LAERVDPCASDDKKSVVLGELGHSVRDAVVGENEGLHYKVSRYQEYTAK